MNAQERTMVVFENSGIGIGIGLVAISLGTNWNQIQNEKAHSSHP